MKNTWRARLWPLEVEREIPDDRYLIVFSVHIEELEPPVPEGWQAVLAMLSLGQVCR
jgi:hypothetical protein